MSHWSQEHALSYDQTWGELEFHRKIPELAKVADNFSIIELGCGGGYLSLCLAQCAAGVKVIGLDPSEQMIALAKARQQNANISKTQVKFVKSGAEQLVVAANSVDIAIAAFSVHHWQDPQLAMALIYRGLKPKGRIWLSEDLNTPVYGDLQVNSELKAFSGIKALLENTGFNAISHTVYESNEGKFLIVEAAK